MNVPRIKGTHTAMKSGMLAADAAFREIVLAGDDTQAPLHMNGYARQLEGSWVNHELTQARFHTCIPIGSSTEAALYFRFTHRQNFVSGLLF